MPGDSLPNLAASVSHAMRCDAMRCDAMRCDAMGVIVSVTLWRLWAVQCSAAGASEVEREEGVTSRASLLVCIAY